MKIQVVHCVSHGRVGPLCFKRKPFIFGDDSGVLANTGHCTHPLSSSEPCRVTLSEAWLQRHLIVSNIVAFCLPFFFLISHTLIRTDAVPHRVVSFPEGDVGGGVEGAWMCSTCLFLFFSGEKLDSFFP